MIFSCYACIWDIRKFYEDEKNGESCHSSSLSGSELAIVCSIQTVLDKVLNFRTSIGIS